MYLIDEVPIRYGLKLFQFIYNLMVFMCLVQEALKCTVGWLKLTVRTRSVNKMNWNMQQYAGKELKSRASVGH